MGKYKIKNGLYVVTTTPFTKKGNLDENAIRQNVDWYIEKGVDGIDCTGSTGEFDKLSDEERRKVIEITVDQVGGRVCVLAGTGGRSTKEAVEWTKFAKEAGVDGAMVIPPYYNPLTADEIYSYYQSIAETVDLVIMPYNNPVTSGIDMQPELISKMAREIENIAYVKEASGDPRRVQQISYLAGDNITLFWGEETAIFPALALGAQGWISGSSNIIPDKCKMLFDMLVKDGNIEEARVFHRKLLPLLLECEGDRWLPVIKAGMDIRGESVGGPLREPVLPLNRKEKQRVREMITEALRS